MLKFWDLLAGWKLTTNTKFQLSISKLIPANAQNIETWGVTIVMLPH